MDNEYISTLLGSCAIMITLGTFLLRKLRTLNTRVREQEERINCLERNTIPNNLAIPVAPLNLQNGNAYICSPPVMTPQNAQPLQTSYSYQPSQTQTQVYPYPTYQSPVYKSNIV